MTSITEKAMFIKETLILHSSIFLLLKEVYRTHVESYLFATHPFLQQKKMNRSIRMEVNAERCLLEPDGEIKASICRI